MRPWPDCGRAWSRAAAPPSRIHDVPCARTTSVANRAAMNAPNAHHSQVSPASRVPDHERQRDEHRQGDHPGNREVASVTGTDEDAVEHEHHPVHRLPDRLDQQARWPAGRAPAGSGLNRPGRPGARPAGADPKIDAGGRTPPRHQAGQGTRAHGIAGTERLSGQGLRGDGDRVERERQQPPDVGRPPGARRAPPGDSAAATTTVTSSATRRVSVRTIRGADACAACRTPGRSGASDVPRRTGDAHHHHQKGEAGQPLGERRADRGAGEPETRPSRRCRRRGPGSARALTDCMATAMTSGVLVSATPRSMPVAAMPTRSAGRPSAAIRR